MKYILLSVCGDREAVVEEILSWAGDREDDMAFKYNIIRAFEDEREEGKEEGKTLMLISQIRRKVRKNNSVTEIADMLEEESASIAPIYALLRDHPDWEDERIYRELVQLENGGILT